MPLRHRCEYAADLPRSLPGGSCPPPRKFPAHTLNGCAPLPAQIHQVSSRRRIKGMSHIGSSRIPLRPACRTRPIWQYWPVPALSGLLPPSPAPPGSGCPQLHRPAATGSAAKVFHLHSNHSASRRTLSRSGARFRCCHRPVSPDRSPNPPCGLLRNGLSTVAAVRRGAWWARGAGSCCPGTSSGSPLLSRSGRTRPRLPRSATAR